MRRSFVLGLLAAVLATGLRARAAEDPLDVAVRADLTHAAQRLTATVGKYSTATTYPWYTATNGTWVTAAAKKWTSGFMPGALWMLYQATGTASWRTSAIKWQTGIASQATRTDDMDIGFKVLDSFGAGHRLTSTADYKTTVLKAAASLATRWNDGLGLIRSWDNPAGAPASDFRVIVDGLNNLELLFWAADHGGPAAYRDMAHRHALRVLQDFVRPDGSVYQLITYDSDRGVVKTKGSELGYSPTSMWARGQAWAIRGFSLAYRETGDAALLRGAERTADAYLARLPADMVPPWDFDAPAPAPKDSSAAAIAASGLLELARLDTTDPARAARYLDAARRTLLALSSTAYLTKGTTNAALLAHATYDMRIGISNVGAIWGDYFFLEALMRLRLLAAATPALPVAAVRGSVDTAPDRAANAVDGNLATRWSANGTSQWLRLDLGAPKPVTKVTVAYALGDERSSLFSIQTSSDGSAFTTRATVRSSGGTLQPETYDIPDVTTRYVRILARGSAVDTWNRISEVTVR